MSAKNQPINNNKISRPVTKQMILSFGLIISLILLALMLVGNVILGAADITPHVIQSLFAFDETLFDHLVIRTVRLPRVVAGAFVGASLAVAGAIMQGLTRNPLASPGILGINAGASFAVVLAVYVLGSLPGITQIKWSA